MRSISAHACWSVGAGSCKFPPNKRVSSSFHPRPRTSASLFLPARHQLAPSSQPLITIFTEATWIFHYLFCPLQRRLQHIFHPRVSGAHGRRSSPSGVTPVGDGFRCARKSPPHLDSDWLARPSVTEEGLVGIATTRRRVLDSILPNYWVIDF